MGSPLTFWLVFFLGSICELFLPGCVSQNPRALVPTVPDITTRKLVLVFEREKNYRPIPLGQVTLSVSAPVKLLSPSQGKTNPDGSFLVSYEPIAIYDQNALEVGDIVIDYPAVIYVKLETADGLVFNWELSDHMSYARYADPLYQGLNREPTPGPIYYNLSIP